MRSFRFVALTTLAVTLFPTTTLAGRFPDVPDSHPYFSSVELLAGRGVVQGNPNGLFNPSDRVNRAAFLKMLYAAKGLIPKKDRTVCFSDVDIESWYGPIVCDAVAMGFVRGYGNGLFMPNASVNRVEALKMMALVFGLQATDPALNLPYTDIPGNTWFATYVGAAVEKKILPIRGQEGPNFHPDWPMTRGEATAYIAGALNAPGVQTSSTSSVATETQASSAVTRQSSSAATIKSNERVIALNFPFADTQQFQEKATISYRFTLGKPELVVATALLGPKQEGGISCRLYKLVDAPEGASTQVGGFSYEYYLGYQQEGGCYLKTALPAGQYQLQLQPTTKDVSYTIEVTGGSGDGNDGFREAKSVPTNTTRTDVLEANDYEDWFTFTVATEKEMTLSLTSASNVRCLIYPLADVDLFGFSGPQCNQPYLFPKGTYVVGIGHAYPKATKQTYTIRLK